MDQKNVTVAEVVDWSSKRFHCKREALRLYGCSEEFNQFQCTELRSCSRFSPLSNLSKYELRLWPSAALKAMTCDVTQCPTLMNVCIYRMLVKYIIDVPKDVHEEKIQQMQLRART